MNQPSKKGFREDFGGGRGSNGDAATTCGDKLTVPPPNKTAPIMDARALLNPRARSDVLLADACAAGTAFAPPLVSPAASFRLPLRRCASHGNDHAAVVVGGCSIAVAAGSLPEFLAPPLSDTT